MSNKTSTGTNTSTRNPRKILGGTLALVLLLLSGGTLHNSLGFPELNAVGIVIKEPKKKPRRKRGRCCSLGIAYTSGPGFVILDRICKTRAGTVVKFRTKRLRSICTYPPATAMYDDKKRKYSMVKHAGLPNCIFGTSKKYNQKFTWVFKPLRRGVKKVSIIEHTDPNTAGYSYWAWRNIDISKCKFR